MRFVSRDKLERVLAEHSTALLDTYRNVERKCLVRGCTGQWLARIHCSSAALARNKPGARCSKPVLLAPRSTQLRPAERNKSARQAERNTPMVDRNTCV